MQNGIFQLSWTNVKSAIVYGAILGLFAIFAYAAKIGDLWALDWHVLVNTFVFAFGGSLFKNLLTTNSGSFLGLTQVVDKS